MHRRIPDPSNALTILLIYVGIGCIAALVIVAVHWWWRHRDPLNFRHRSYAERLVNRFDQKRARARRIARKATNRRRQP